MGPCSAHRQAGSCQWFCRFHWRQHPRFRSDPASRHNCYCFLFRCPCVFSLSLWFSFSLYIAVVFLLYAEALICGWKTNWREKNKRGELYYRSLYLICQKHESLNVIFLFLFYFFWVDPGQPIWPVTRSLDRVDHRVGFQNYTFCAVFFLV